MRIILGQLILLLTIQFCFFLSFNDYRFPNHINIEMLVWTILLLIMGVWTIWSPKPAFVIIWIYYLATAIYRVCFLEIEILLYFLGHIFFISVITLSIWGAFSNEKRIIDYK